VAYTKTKKAQRRAAMAKSVADLHRLTDVGCTIKLMAQVNGHYRITGPKGGMVDFWAPTTKWREFTKRTDRPKVKGKGMEALLEVIVDLDLPPLRHHGETVVEPRCGECGQMAELVTGDVVYRNRPDLREKRLYLCKCGAYVGCHPGTTYPLGYPAGPETRAARSAAHAVFDPLWKRKAQKEGISVFKARGRGYRWLAEQLGIERADCHISHFDKATCERVVALCTDPATRKAPEVADA
jgi:hypothetical protein